jgi:hypothetical protein
VDCRTQGEYGCEQRGHYAGAVNVQLCDTEKAIVSFLNRLSLSVCLNCSSILVNMFSMCSKEGQLCWLAANIHTRGLIAHAFRCSVADCLYSIAISNITTLQAGGDFGTAESEQKFAIYCTSGYRSAIARYSRV